jgi:hypothetical protein
MRSGEQPLALHNSAFRYTSELQKINELQNYKITMLIGTAQDHLIVERRTEFDKLKSLIGCDCQITTEYQFIALTLWLPWLVCPRIFTI